MAYTSQFVEDRWLDVFTPDVEYSAFGTPYTHAGFDTAINDNNLTTAVDTWSNGGTEPLSYVGVMFPTMSPSQITFGRRTKVIEEGLRENWPWGRRHSLPRSSARRCAR